MPDLNSLRTEAEQLDYFESRIANGEKIEPGDWMPDESEGEWISRAPSLKRKLILIAKVQDEAGHGQYLYHAAETLGATREEMLNALLEGRAKYSSIFNYPTLTWADVGTIGWLVDGAAIRNQTMLAQCSYGPYSRAMVRICSEETFHHKQGKEMMLLYAKGTEKQRQMAQDAINRWWWPSMMMLGPHDADSPNTGILVKWGVKTKTNDEVRQEFLNEHAPEILEAGLTIPDPDLKYDEATGNWQHGPIDWDEFWQVVKGNGQMNKARLEAKQSAHDEGAWVREAMQAYGERKQAERVAA